MKNTHKQYGIYNTIHHNSIFWVEFNGNRADSFLVNPKHSHEVFHEAF